MKIWMERLRRLGWLVAAASVVMGTGIWIVFGKQMPPEIPLWYSQPWGESQLAKPDYLLILPGMTVGVGLLGGVVVKKLSKYGTLAIMVGTTNLVGQIIMVLGMLRILFVVI